MPKELHGEWCARDNNYQRLTKCKDEPDGIEVFALEIGREEFGSEHSMCKPLEVRKQGDAWIVKARCADHIEGKVTSIARTSITHYSRSGAYLLIKEK